MPSRLVKRFHTPCFYVCLFPGQDGQEVPDEVLVPLMVLGMDEATTHLPPVVEVSACLLLGLQEGSQACA